MFKIKGGMMMKKRIVFIALLLISSILSAEQSGGYPENYFDVLQKDLEAVPQVSEQVRLAKEAGDISVESMAITSVDIVDFPNVKLYTVIRDNEGKHVAGLGSSDFELYVKHEDDKLVLGQKLSSLTVEELGSVESKADIAFVIDSTGSMSGQISTVKSNIIAFVNKLVDQNVSYRLAGYDYGDEVPYRSHKPFTDDAESFKGWVGGLSASGGNDWPENPLDSIISAGHLTFRADAQQIIVLITDAPAHVAGDEGNSPTSATFSATASAIGDKKFYYFSSVTDYSSLGTNLGGTYFSADALINTFSEEITGKYIVSFDDPNGERDGLKRIARLKHKESGTSAKAEYTPEAVEVTLSGGITNTDSPPSPLIKARVEAIHNKSGKSVIDMTDETGKYSMNLTVGTYTVKASMIEYRTEEELSVVLEEEVKEKTVNFELPRATIAEEKNSLIAVTNRIKAYGSTFSTPYADEAIDVLEWVNELPTVADGDEDDPTDAQKEGLKRLIQASIILDTTNGYVTKDAEVLGQSIGEVAVSILTLSGTFDKLQTYILGAVGALPDSDSWIGKYVVSKIKKVLEYTATKIGQLNAAIANTILDFISMKFPSSDYPFTANTITFLKDIINAADGKPAFTGLITSKITPWISKQVIIPLHANEVKDTYETSLNRSKSITSADFDVMAGHLSAANNELQEIVAEFKKLEGQYATIGGIKNYLTAVKNVLGVIHKLDPFITVLVTFPATAPYTVPIKGALEVADKVLEGGNLIIAGTTAAYSGTHLYFLSDDTNRGMNSAYGLAGSGKFVGSHASMRNTSAWNTYVAKKQSRAASSCSTDPVASFMTSVDNAIKSIEENNLTGFADGFVDDMGVSLDCLTDELNILKAKVDAGATLASKPVNYDLLSQLAYENYMGLQNTSLSYMLKVTSITLGASINASEDGKFGTEDEDNKEALKILLGEWKSLAKESADAMANAVNSVSGNIASKPIVVLASMMSDTEKITETSASFTVSVLLKNISTNSASDIVVSLGLPKELEDAALSSSLGKLFKTSELLDTDELNQTVASLAAGESIDVNWTIRVDSTQVLKNEAFNFIASATSSSGTVVSGSQMLSIPAEPADSDGDKIPDHWESEYGLDKNDASDALKDKDADGLNNITEYRYSYDPTRKESTTGLNDLTAYLTIDSEKGLIRGDVNGDSRIDSNDLALVKELWQKDNSDTGYDSRADMNGNSYIDIEDIMLINAYVKVYK